MYGWILGSKIARNGDGKGDGEIPGVGGGGAVEWLGYHPIGLKKEAPPPPTTLPPPPPAPTTCSNNNICSNGKHDFREQSVSYIAMHIYNTYTHVTFSPK